jgi:hypothetical protein
MAQSLNTTVKLTTNAILYLGIGAKYGKILIGDKAFEFFNDANVEDFIQIPWQDISEVQGVVTLNNKIGRQFVIVLEKQGASKRTNQLRFSSKETGKVLKIIREQLGDEKVVRTPTLLKIIKSKFRRKKS